MFSEGPVHSQGRGGSPLWRMTHWIDNPLDNNPSLDRDPPGQRPPDRVFLDRRGDHCSGWYASYWNALLWFMFNLQSCTYTLIQ